MRGMEPKWVDWTTIDHMTSVFGILLDIDWKSRYSDVCEVVRVKILCKDYNKIPQDRVFGIGGNLYIIKIAIEVPESTVDKNEDIVEEDEDDLD